MRTSLFKSLGLWPAFPALVLMIAVFAFNAVLNPNLLSNGGMTGFASTTLPLIAASLGQAILLLGRGLDLSMGATISFINVFAVTLFGMEYTTPTVIALTMIAALSVGLLNALLVVFLRINALLATFAVSFITGGLALWLLPAPGGMIPGELVVFAMDSTLSIPNGLLAILIVLLIWVVLKKTSFILQLYAIGGDPSKGLQLWHSVRRIRVISYLISSVFAGVSGLALTFSIGSGDPLIGQSYTLLSISAAVIGGVAIFGGSGDGLGAIFGAVFLAIIPELLLGLGISSFYQQFVLGVIMIAGLAGIVLSKSNS